MAASISTEREIMGLATQLRSIPENLRIFSLNMRSLYAENAIGTLSETDVEFNELRDDIRNDSLVYVKAVLPATTVFVRMIRSFFGEYKATEFDEWKKCLVDEIEEMKGYRQFCEVLLFMHEKVMKGLKKKEYQADKLVKKLAATSKEFEMKMEEMTEAASLKEKYAAILTFLPKVGPIAAAFFQLYGEYNRSSAVAHQREAGGLYGAASAVVNGTLIPALAAFLDVLRASSSFFSVQVNLLILCQEKGLDSQKEIDSAEDINREEPMETHHKVMRNWAGEIEANCDIFFAVLPNVRTDFEAIPEEGTDTNVVQAWLDETKREIQQMHREGQLTKLVQSKILDLKL